VRPRPSPARRPAARAPPRQATVRWPAPLLRVPPRRAPRRRAWARRPSASQVFRAPGGQVLPCPGGSAVPWPARWAVPAAVQIRSAEVWRGRYRLVAAWQSQVRSTAALPVPGPPVPHLPAQTGRAPVPASPRSRRLRGQPRKPACPTSASPNGAPSPGRSNLRRIPERPVPQPGVPARLVPGRTSPWGTVLRMIPVRRRAASRARAPRSPRQPGLARRSPTP
jgi:hypothetical protein